MMCVIISIILFAFCVLYFGNTLHYYKPETVLCCRSWSHIEYPGEDQGIIFAIAKQILRIKNLQVVKDT